MDSGKPHRLGWHQTNLFVSSKFDISVDYDAHTLGEPGLQSPYADGLQPPQHPQVNDHDFRPDDDRIFTMHPSELRLDDNMMHPQSHRTEHGLYLTWSMIASIAMIGLALVVFIARFVILRQKRKWEHSPNLEPMTAPSSSEDKSSGGVSLPPPARDLTLLSPGKKSWSKNQLRVNKNLPVRSSSLPVSRSVSMVAMGSHSFESPVSKKAMPFISEKESTVLPLPSLSTTGAPQLSLVNETLLPSAVATTTSRLSPQPTAKSSLKRTHTEPVDASPSADDKFRQGADNIDGIPLVRYSRYTSEFKEILPLGRGGFGTVFRCQNALDSREYAIKKIKILSQLSVDGKVTKHFSQKLHRVLREVKCLALLDHPNIVRYYTAWLEVDEGNQNEDDETNTTSSIFDRKSQGIFSSSLFTGFGSSSRAMQTSSRPQKTILPRTTKGFLGSYNPLGWNNFGSSMRLDESTCDASSSIGAPVGVPNGTFGAEEDDEDLGFTWERSDENTVEPSKEPSMGAKKQLSRKIEEA